MIITESPKTYYTKSIQKVLEEKSLNNILKHIKNFRKKVDLKITCDPTGLFAFGMGTSKMGFCIIILNFRELWTNYSLC